MREGIFISKEGDPQFDWKTDSHERDAVFLKFSKNYHISRKRGETVFHICYRLNPSFKGADKRDILKAMGNYLEEDRDYKQFLSKATMGITASPVIDLKSVNLIITPNSQKKLSYDLAKEVEAKTSNIPLYPKFITKVDIESITLDYDKIKQKKVDPKIVEWLEGMLEGMKDRGEFKIKNIRPQYRSLVTNFLKLTEEDRRLINLINGGTVMVIDDYFTTGSTLVESEKLLKTYGASEVILVAILG